MKKNYHWAEDLAAYDMKYPFLKEQSIWAIWIYRRGQYLFENKSNSLLYKIQVFIYWQLFRLIETITGISIPWSVHVGPGLRIWHFGNIFIHPNTKIGARCTLRQGVTIGNRRNASDAPTIGNDVEIGAYAQILGAITIGNNCKIGAMSVVLSDIPDGATVVGNPAKIIKKQ
jgi:serine O-acetyltransferase